MEFKWLKNLSNKDFVWQFDGVIYELKAKTKKLFLKEVAEHGLKRSHYLTNPEIDDVTGELITSGNDIWRSCELEDAQVESPVGYTEPILVQAAEEMQVTSETHDLVIKTDQALTNLKKRMGRKPKLQGIEVQNAGQNASE